MIDNKAKTTAADKVITREPIVVEKYSFNLPKSEEARSMTEPIHPLDTLVNTLSEEWQKL